LAFCVRSSCQRLYFPDPGRAAGAAVTHIAVQERVDGKAVEWLEHVSDGEYLEN